MGARLGDHDAAVGMADEDRRTALRGQRALFVAATSPASEMVGF